MIAVGLAGRTREPTVGSGVQDTPIPNSAIFGSILQIVMGVVPVFCRESVIVEGLPT